MPRGEHNALKTECPAGHELVGDNVRISQTKAGPKRVCRKCVRDKAAARYAASRFPR